MYSIKTEGLKKSFKTAQALCGVNIDFSQGSIHGIIGSDGAGKTTLLRLIAGLMIPDGGDIAYYDGNTQITQETFRQNCSYMPQQASLYSDLSVEEHLSFFKNLYEIEKDVFKERSEHLLKITGMENFKSRRAGKLSGGMYKKLGLMCAMLASPSVLLLDEPTNGVDPISRRDFWNLLYDLAKQNILIIYATAYMDEASRCSRVYLMDKGKLLTSGEPRALLDMYKVNNFDELFIRNENAF